MPNTLLTGRQTRAESVGVCLGLSDHEQHNLLSSPLQGGRIRRRSTRRRLSQGHKPINFGEWANKR